jgi:CDP-diacylglycerol--glycerol-3-phosphate 3-phosphatidyltransferase
VPKREPKRRSIREDALNLPNLLTSVRIVLIPVVLYLLAAATPAANFWATMVYIGCAITDFIDGWLARRQGLVSILGKFLDPLADKLLVMATLVFIVFLGRVDKWGAAAVILLVGREISITALRAIAMSEGVVIAASSGGKDKTALQMVAVLLLMLQYRYDLNFFFGTLRGVDLNQVGTILLYISVFFSITSAGEYVKLFVDAVEAKEKRLGGEA